MPRQDWEDDDDLFSGLEDERAEIAPIAAAPTIIRVSPPAPSHPTKHAAPPKATKRVLRVKPMTAAMRLKWPDVSTCLLTLDTGRQIIFVR